MREALTRAGRSDLIGRCDGLIPAQLPTEAIAAQRKRADTAVRSDHYHSVTNPAASEPVGERSVPPAVGSKGYRPKRATQGGRFKPGRGPKPHSPLSGG